MKRALWGALFAVPAGLGLVLAGGVGWLFSSLPDVDGRITAAGLSAPVDVVRDRRGVPHIYAASSEDAYFALGYVHAQDRLWQMEMMRRLGAGRLSEVVGRRALDTDRFMRLLGLYRLAEIQYGRLSPEVRRALDAYAAGVNAWLEGRGGALPPEFVVTGHAPEPWRPADSLLWARIMAMRLSGNWHDEVLRARLARRLPAARIAELWPPQATDAPITGEAALYRGLRLDGLAAAGWPGHPPRGASNAWVVGGARTKGGKPILANDPHLGFAAPIVWYLARLEAPDLMVSGATVPGVPFTVLGHNRRIAWGITSTHSDLEDLFVELVDPLDPKRYLTPEGPRPFRTRREIIAVKGGEDVELIVRETRHGPVISDVVASAREVAAEGRVLALAATFLGEDDLTPQAVYHLNRADGWPAFRAAMADFHAPQQNLVYADVDGNIGFMAPGRVPVRRSGRGRAPKPGWTGEADWTGFVPFEALPQSFNPAAGRIVTANNRIVGADYPYFISDDWAAGYRARRILDLLAAGMHSADAATNVQLDHVSLMARQLLPLMLGIEPSSARARAALDLLRRWDGSMARGRPEPLVFTAWLRTFNRAVYGDELGEMLPAYWSLRPRFIASVLGGRTAWCDDVGTAPRETCENLLSRALTEALEGLSTRFGPDIAAWRWGDAHAARFRHLVFTGVPLARRFADLAMPTDGGDYTVNRGASSVSDRERPFAHIHGAGLRAVYDLADLEASSFVIATGQSGNPLSSHYDDFLADWRDGRWLRLGLGRETLERQAAGTLTLVPAPAR